MNSNKVALVTAGAGMGIGAGIVRRLAEDGFNVVVTDSHERRSQAMADELSERHGRPFRSFVLDVTDAAMVESVMNQVVDELGGLEVLVNNAGWSKIEPISEMSLETWSTCVNVDLTGTFLCMRYALPHMIAAKSGSIVNISSIAAYETSVEHGGAYSAAKAGVLALTRVAAAENGKHNIRVNAIVPGLIYNDFLRKIYPDEFFDGYAEQRSLVGRVGQPEDIANLASFLVSDQAGYITGESYGVSGGVFPHA
jgi:3-oxoacyl-[acyl-carrier protein] reductase